MKASEDEVHEGRMCRFQVNTVRTYRTPIERQIAEAVKLKLASKKKIRILNSKLEYNACIIPEVAVIFGKKLKEEEDHKPGEEGRKPDKRKDQYQRLLTNKKLKLDLKREREEEYRE